MLPMEEVKPMLAVRGKPFDSSDYIYEIKWDGTRCIAFVDTELGKVKLQNRRLFDITFRYPEIVDDLLKAVKEPAILDGEILVMYKGKPSFSLLQQREHVDSKFKIKLLSKKIPAVYIVFDILYSSKNWVTKNSLLERRKILAESVKRTKRCTISEYVKGGGGRGVKFYEEAVKMELEGVMAKKLDSVYLPGKRSDFWIKIKKKNTVDCIIVGWLEGEGEREGKFGSLILALKDGENLVHVGQVGTGFENEFLEWFSKELKKIEVKSKPFSQDFKRKAHWVKPVYVCEVEYLEVTEDGKLRAPIFLRLKNDKSPDECTVQQLWLS